MPAATADAVLDALGDPTRRTVLALLREGPQAVGVLAERLPVSRPAVSQHLRVLKRADLVVDQRVGTRHLYRINSAGFVTVRRYLDGFWTDTLHNFAALAVTQAQVVADRAEQVPTDPPSGDPSHPEESP